MNPETLRFRIRAAIAAVVLAVGFAPACGSEDPTTGDEDNIVPDDAATLFDQAGVCDQTLKRHVAVRAGDLKDGLIRWNCADVAGVESDDRPGAGRGQEYCEYHAMQGGKEVTRFDEVDPAKPLSCFFTSVYWDHDGKNVEENPDEVPGPRDAQLAKSLGGSKALAAPVDPDMIRMKSSINSRGAANTLIDDCANIEPDVGEERQVACYTASLKGNATALRKACRGVDLSKSDKWKKAQSLGAKLFKEGEAGYEEQRDIIGCLALHRAEHGGATFRNSDPMICGRVYRAKQECGCEWSELPASLEGFLFTGWTADKMPTGCRRVTVSSKSYPHMTVCTVPSAEAAELEFSLDFAEDLQKFCNERFAKDIVMKAPLRAVEVAGSCRTDTPFCAAFAGQAAQ